jgi:hypothetical protein
MRKFAGHQRWRDGLLSMNFESQQPQQNTDDGYITTAQVIALIEATKSLPDRPLRPEEGNKCTELTLEQCGKVVIVSVCLKVAELRKRVLVRGHSSSSNAEA